MPKAETNIEKKESFFIIFNQQRWDQVQLIKGFRNKEAAEKLRNDLEENEDRYEEIYRIEEIEIEDSIETIKRNKKDGYYLRRIRKIIKFWHDDLCPKCGNETIESDEPKHQSTYSFKCLKCGFKLPNNHNYAYIEEIDNIAKKGLKEKKFKNRRNEIYEKETINIDKYIDNLENVVERLELEFPLIYRQKSNPLAIGIPEGQDTDFMKVMIIPELKNIITNLKEIKRGGKK